MNKRQENPQEISRASAGVQKVKVSKSTYGNTLRTRARVRENFYGPTITLDVDAAVDYALKATHNSTNYRSVLCFYCLRLGLNTFLDQLDLVLALARQGEIRDPARALHARLRRLKNQLDQTKGGRV